MGCFWNWILYYFGYYFLIYIRSVIASNSFLKTLLQAILICSSEITNGGDIRKQLDAKKKRLINIPYSKKNIFRNLAK
jgi:hypothetical protein